MVDTLAGCTVGVEHSPCGNVGPEEIVTNELSGVLGYIAGKGTSTPEVGQKLFPKVKKGLFAEFDCVALGEVKAGEGVGKLGDCIIAPFTAVNVMSTDSTQLYSAIRGASGMEQLPQHFEGVTKACNMEYRIGEGGWERAVGTESVTRTNEEAIEIKA